MRRVRVMPAPKCEPDCQCGKHFRTKQHNERIAASVHGYYEDKRRKNGKLTDAGTVSVLKDAQLAAQLDELG